MMTKGNNSCKELKLGAWHRKCSLSGNGMVVIIIKLVTSVLKV